MTGDRRARFKCAEHVMITIVRIVWEVTKSPMECVTDIPHLNSWPLFSIYSECGSSYSSILSHASTTTEASLSARI